MSIQQISFQSKVTVSASVRVIAACEKWWPSYKADCSGFVKAVARELGVSLTGQANSIVDQIRKPPFSPALSGAQAAKAASSALVIGGLKASPNGHVVIVVPGLVAQGKYPTAYWGMLHGVGKKAVTINWAWDKEDRDKVIYGWTPL